jgi:hypothetical protein
MPQLDATARQYVYEALLCAAFWVALWRFDAVRASALRFVAGLALGALFARAGGLLFAPAGLLLAAPLVAPARASFLSAALPALPLAFATAKLGCVAAGCCAVAGGEALGFAALGLAVRASPRVGAGLALAGIGAVRLATLPLRPEAMLSALPALLWLALAALRCRPSHGDERCPRPGNATSNGTPPSSRPGCGVSSAAPATSR